MGEERFTQIVAESGASGAIDIFRGVEIHAGRFLAVILAAIANLLQNFVPIALGVGACHKIDIVAGIVVAIEMLGNVAPPIGERSEGIGGVGGFPIELW